MYSHNNPLSTAIFYGKEDEVKALLEKKASMNIVEEDGNTPLLLAAVGQHLNILKMLLEHQADINQKKHIDFHVGYDLTALFAAIIGSGDVNIVKLLLEQKADMNVDNMSALKISAIHNREKIVSLLLTEYKVDINQTDFLGNTALMNAAYMGSLAVVKVLLKFKNLNLYHKNPLGKTARDRAAEQEQLPVLKILDEVIFREKQGLLVFGLFGTGESTLKTLSKDYLFDRNIVKMVTDLLRPKLG